jgi:hypothetical protein
LLEARWVQSHGGEEQNPTLTRNEIPVGHPIAYYLTDTDVAKNSFSVVEKILFIDWWGIS